MVGEFARTHGAKVPTRLVSSAKSWLSHAGVDRQSAIQDRCIVAIAAQILVTSRSLRQQVNIAGIELDCALETL